MSSARVTSFRAVAQQRMTTRRRRRCDRARAPRPTTRPNARAQAAVLAAPLRRPASTTTAAPPNGGHQAIAGQESVAGGTDTRRIFGEQQPVLADAMQQRGMPCRIGNVDPPASTATVRPSAASAARCAAPSMP